MKIIIDASNFTWRAYWANRDLDIPIEEEIGAVHGFIYMLQKLMEEYGTDVILVWDAPGKTWRHRLVEEYVKKGILSRLYKAQRKNVTDEHVRSMIKQVHIIKDIIDHLGLLQVQKVGEEADDVIAYLVDKFSNEGKDDILIVSRDKDFYALLRGDKIKQLDSGKVWTEQSVKKEYGISPRLWFQLGALSGDKSDNLEGVRGIGFKTARKLLLKYGNLKRMLDDLSNLAFSDALASRVMAHKPQLLACYKLKKLRPERGEVRLGNKKEFNIESFAEAVGQHNLDATSILSFQKMLG